MPDLTPAARSALWAWSFVEQSAARVHSGVDGILSSSNWPLDATRETGAPIAQLWSDIKAAEPDNPDWHSVTFGAGLSSLRGIANAAVTAQHNLARAEPGWAITHDYVADWVTARPLAARNAQPRYMVRIDVTGLTRGGAQLTKTINVMYNNALPATVGDLVDEATQVVINRALASDFTPISTGVPQILAV